MISLIIVANGTGQRFGENKMLVKIENEYLINKTINCFKNIEQIKEVILVSNKEVFDVVENDSIIFCEGGSTRSESVKIGLEKCTEEFVMIHDGARPYVSKRIINESIMNLENNDCVVPVLKVTNCLKQFVKNKIKTVNREGFVQSQTPQSFKTKIIKEAYNKNLGEFYDDCQLLENDNYKIKLIEGSEKNKKITFKEDL
ncbi:IspD/TarI family cytidylyltransferase [Spiroplasma endosymbiont of Diplazon laetatorius]|uniref:IspD/TarI family cytidylyltransferase n=1 Tax=Spiroplasma endosymbiont of Diplazon laetatorius TaxID=3066322 RepID=UPI0030D50185